MHPNPKSTPATRSLAASLYRQLRRDGFGPAQVRALAEQLHLLADAQADVHSQPAQGTTNRAA